MILAIWKNSGFVQQFEFGKTLVGITHFNQRPDIILLNSQEAIAYFDQPDIDMYIDNSKQYKLMLKKAVKQDGVVMITDTIF